MENEVDLSPGNPLDLTPRGLLAGENLALPTSPDLSSTPNRGPGSSPLYPGLGQGTLGSNRTMYPAQQSANPLDDAERILKAKRDRMQIGLSGPMSGILQFLAPKEVEKLGADAAQTDLQIQGIQEKRQQQQTNAAMARNMGLTRAMSPTADAAAIGEEALREWRENGNYDAYRGLHGAGQGARADLYMDEGVNALGKKTEAAQSAVDRLNSATTQSEYNSIRADVLKHPEFSSLGMNENNVPKYQLEWKEKRGAITAKLNGAKATVERFNQQQAQLSQAVPIADEKAAKAVTAPLQMSSGESFPNTHAVTLPGAGGAQGALAQPGSKDIAHYGPEGWNNATPENVKTVREQFGAEEVKGAISKYKMARDFAATANNPTMYRTPAGLALLSDELGAIGRDVAEGSKAAGSIGLTKMLDAKYGSVENFLNSATNNYAAWKAWATSGRKGVEPKLEPRLTDQSVIGFKDVANFKLAQTKGELTRAGGPVETAGRYGIGMDKTGLDEGAQNMLRPMWQEALDKAKLDYDKYPAIIKGDRRVILPQDARVPGMIPAGSYAKGLPKHAEGGTDNGLPLVNSTVRPSSPGGGVSLPPTVQGNPVATAVYGAAGQTAMASSNSPVVAKNAAIITTSAARSESAFNPNETHDGGIGYGLFGHNKDRLDNMRTFAGTKPGQPIAPDVQAAFFVKELSEAAERDPFIKKVMNDPNASAADLTKVQMHLERPVGYKKDSPESGHNWQGRLANTQALMQPGQAQPTAEQIAEYNASGQAARRREIMAQSATRNAANIAPALGATAGMLGGPVGTLAGGAAGGAVRQAFNGGPGYVDQMVRGAAEAVPAAIPGVRPLATAARVVAGGAVPAAEKLYDTGGEDVGGAIESGAAGATGSILGEAFGRALGMAGHKIFSRFSSAAQTEVQDAAKTLATQQPKIADATGKMVPNTAYNKAEQVVKDAGIDAEHAAYAYNVSKAGMPKGEALAQRPSAVEAAKTGKEYQAINADMTDAAASMSKNITPRNVQGGPTSLVRDAQNPGGTVPAKYAKDAEDAQLRVTAPAKTWDAKWNQLGEARSDLLKKERDALASTAGDKTERAEAMRALADAVRVQQEKVALHVLGPQKGKAAIARLEAADVRYRNAMVASGDGDIVKAIAQGGAEGRKAQAAFDALAANDPTAQRMVRSLVEMSKSKIERAGVAGATALSAYALLHIPVVGAAAATTVSVLKAQQMLRDYMAKRGAGAPVKFNDMIARESRKGYAARAGSVIGSSVGSQMVQ